MRKLLTAGVTALLVGVFAGSVQATPLSASGALPTSGALQQSLAADGVTKARYYRRHYGWYRWHRRYVWRNPWRVF
jgi:hypothetical protein